MAQYCPQGHFGRADGVVGGDREHLLRNRTFGMMKKVLLLSETERLRDTEAQRQIDRGTERLRNIESEELKVTLLSLYIVVRGEPF